MRISDWSSDVCSSDLTNSGAEALECAIKTARRYHYANGNPQKHKLITFSNAFHGRTLGTISATDQPKMRDGFEPLLPGFQVVKVNDLEAALAAVDDETAGFLLEPIQGDGGILRSEGGRVGTECVGRCSSRRSPYL